MTEIHEMTTMDDIADETGFSRVKNAVMSSESEFYGNASQAAFVGSVLGFLVGGRTGARVSGHDHMVSNQLTIYPSKMQAHREYHSAVVKGFVKNGCRWGWRMGVFAGLYSAYLTMVSEYRNKEHGVNYVAAGALTGATYKLFSGVRGVIVGTIFGTCFSVPLALAVQGFFLLIPNEVKEQYHNLRQEERKKKGEIWQKNLDETDVMIQQWQENLNEDHEQKVNTPK